MVVRDRGNPTRPRIELLPEYVRRGDTSGKEVVVDREKPEPRFTPLPEYRGRYVISGKPILREMKKSTKPRIIEVIGNAFSDVMDDVVRPIAKEVKDKLVMPIAGVYGPAVVITGLTVLGVGGVWLASQGHGHLVDPIMRQTNALMGALMGNKVIDFAHMAIGYSATTFGLNMVNKVLPERLNSLLRIDRIDKKAILGGGVAILGAGMVLPAFGIHIGPALVESWRVHSHLTGQVLNNSEIAAASVTIGGIAGMGVRSFIKAWS